MRIVVAAALVAAVGLLAVLYAPLAAATTGPIATWSAERTAIDGVGGLRGMLIGGAAYGAGRAGCGFVLDGVNDHVRVEDTAALRLASFTLAGWFNPATMSGGHDWITKTVGTSTSDSFAIWQETNQLNVGVGNGGSISMITSSLVPTVGQWVHVAFTFDGTTRAMTLYQDGVVRASGTASFNPVYDFHPFLIGADTDSQRLGRFFQGSIDEVKLYDRALSGAEVGQLAALGSSPSCPNTTPLDSTSQDPIGLWRGELSGLDSVAADHALVNGGVAYVPGRSACAFGFDGANDFMRIADSTRLHPASFTISGWFKPATLSGSAVWIAKNAGSGSAESFVIWHVNGVLFAAVGDPNGISQISANPGNIAGSWTHVAYTFNTADHVHTLYVNGAAIATGTSSLDPAYDDKAITVGAEYDSGNFGWYYAGLIDELTIHERALSASQVAQLAAAAPSGDCNATYAAAPLLINETFEGALLPGWTRTITSTTPTGGRRFLGEFGNNNEGVFLNLSGLTTHAAIVVTFDAYILKSWDGHTGCCGPDIFGFNIDNGSAWETTFANAGQGQGFPDIYPATAAPGRSGANESNTMGYSFFYGDTVYRLSFTVPHTSSGLQLGWWGHNLQGISDESWGLDNVQVRLLGTQELNLTADFVREIPDIVNAPRTITFRDTSHGGYSPPNTWVWDLGDGTQPLTQNATHTYAADGDYAVQLAVANPHGQVSSVTKTIHVDSIPPVTVPILGGTLGTNAWYTSPVSVILSATDERSGVNHTFYALDGAAPVEYTGAFSVTSNGLHSVTFWSVDVNGNRETNGTTSFQIDRTPPVALAPSVTGPLGLAGWYVGDVTTFLNGTDNTSGIARLEYQFDATPNLTYSPSGVLLATDGTYLLRDRAVDNAGLVSAEQNATIRRDATRPQVNGLLSGTLGGGGWWLGPVSANLTASDATSGLAYLNASLDGAAAAPVTGLISVSGQGIHTITTSASDVAGNANTSLALTIPIDITPPTSEIHLDGTVGTNGIFISAVNLTFTGNDTGSGIDHSLYSIDGSPEAVWNGSLSILAAGQHRVVYHAVDVAGNAETIHELVLTLNLDAPATTLTLTGAPGQNGWFLSNVTANLTVDDYSTLDHIVFGIVVGQSIVHNTYTQEFPIAGDGVHNITFNSVSIGGLVEEEHSQLVDIDLFPPTLAPALSGTLGLNGWYTSPVSASLVAADSASGIATTLVSADGAPLSTYTGAISFASTGTHTIAGRTSDIAGRVTDLASTNVAVDLADPVTTLTLSPAAPDGAHGWYVTAPTVSLAATDAGAGVDTILLSIDGAPDAIVTGPITLPEGVHTLSYHAVDLAGRLEAARATTVTVDLTPPTLSDAIAATAGNAGWYVSAATLTLSPTDATSGVSQVLARVDGGAEANVTQPIPLTTTGTHTIVWRAIDDAGLITTRTVTIPIDLAPPVATPSVSPGANGFGWRNVGSTLTVAGTDAGSGVATLRYAIDGAAFQDYASAIAIGEGFHNVSVYGIDIAGLVGSTTTIPVKVDLTDPAGSATFPTPARGDGWFMAPIAVPVAGSDSPSGLRDLRWQIDNGGLNSAASGTSLNIVTEGQHTLGVLARDFADRVSPEATFPYKLDLTPPTTTHALSGTFGGSNRSVNWYRSNVGLSLASTDAGAGVAGVTAIVDGASQTYNGALSFTTEGAHNVSYFATDLVDRVEASHAIPTFGIDRTPPAIVPTIDGRLDPEDNVYKTVVNVTLSATDPLSGVAGSALKVRVDHGALTTYAGTISFDVSGDHIVEFQATDVAGNVAPMQNVTFSLFVDTTPPVTTLTPDRAPTAAGWYGAPVTLSICGTDAQSSVAAILTQLDGDDLVTTQGSCATVPLGAEGIHNVTYAAIDIAGNPELFRTAQFKVDLTPPSLTVAPTYTAGDNGWIVSPVSFVATPTDGLSGVQHVLASVNGGSYSVVDSGLRLAQSGWYNVSMRATDNADLLGDIVSWSGHLDLDAPVPNVLVVGPQGLAGWHNNNVSVLLAGFDQTSGLSALDYSWDNGTFTPYPGQVFQFAQEGYHYLQVRARDLAGNTAFATPIVVGIDRTAPLISSTLDGASGNDGWFVSPVRITTGVVDAPGATGAAVSGIRNFTRIVDGGANVTSALPSVVDLATSGVHTLHGYALDLALNGRVTDLRVPVDLDDPTLATNVSGVQGLNGWYVSNVTLAAVSVDPTSGPTAPLLNGSPMLSPTKYATDGLHDLTLQAVDVAGRLGVASPLTIPIDQTPPSPYADLTGDAGADGWFHGPATVTLGMNDITSGPGEIRFRIDNGSLQSYGGPFTISADGLHQIDWVALDVAGNAVERTLQVKIDTDAPVAADNVEGVVGNNSWFRSAVNITLDASDPTSGVASIEYRLDGGAWIPYVGPFTIADEGRHVLQYRAIDASGLPSITYEHDILIDITTPVVDLHLENTLFVKIDGKVYIRGTLCIEITGLDALSGLNSLALRVKGSIERLINIDLSAGLTCVDLDGGGGGGGGGGDGGDCEICAIASDLAGNDDIECFEAVDDPNPPTVDFVRPFPGALNVQNASVPLFRSAFADGATVDVPLASGTIPTPLGDQTFGGPTKIAIDNATLANTTLVAGTRVPVWVLAHDDLSPIMRVELRVDGKVLGVTNRSQNVTFQYVTLKPNETSGNEELRTLDVTMPAYVFYIDTLALPAGNHTLAAKAWDAASNVAAVSDLVGYVSPAVGNATMNALNGTLGPQPAPADKIMRAASILARLYDFLATDNYAFVDRTVVEHMDAYATADQAIATLPAPLPPTAIAGADILLSSPVDTSGGNSE